MLGSLSKSARLSRGVLRERPDGWPRAGGRPRSLAATLLATLTLCVAVPAGAQGTPGGLEVASRSAHRTAPRFPSQEDAGAMQAAHEAPIGDDGRGYVQPAQYVPRSRLMQQRMMSRGGYSAMGQTMYENDLSVAGEVVYEGAADARLGSSAIVDGGIEVSEGEVIYEGDFPPGMLPPGARVMSGGSMGRAGGMFRGGMLGGGLGAGGVGVRGGLLGGRAGARGGFLGGGGMTGGMGCSSCGGTAPVWDDGMGAGPGCCDGGYDMGCGGCCDPCMNCCNGCNACCLLFNPRTNFEVFAGAHAFRGVPNLDSSGSFGFYEGFMLSGPVPCLPGEPLSWEFGGLFSQTDFEGSPYTENQRNQAFATAGLFRRVDWGMQGGVVADFMNDHWYATSNLFQVRGELSWVYPSGHEFGAWATRGINQSGDVANVTFQGAAVQGNIETKPIDLYALFYRKSFCEGGDARVFGGVTNRSHAIVGADFRVPVTCNWGLQAGFTYLVPGNDYDRSVAGVLFEEFPKDAWNVNVGVVWSFGGRLRDPCNYHRALLPVANNGTFHLERRLVN